MTVLAYKSQLKDHCIKAASTVHAECVQILTTKNDHDKITTLAGCGTALVDLLSRQANITHILYRQSANDAKKPALSQKYELALKRLEDIASIAYSKFYAYVFKDLPVCWRQLYTDAQILKFCLLFLRSPYVAQNESERIDPFDETFVGEPGHDCCLDELVKTLDLALILAGGAGEKRGRRWIDEALRLLHLIWLEEREDRQHVYGDAGASHGRPAKRSKIMESSSSSSSSESLNMNSAPTMDPTFSVDEPFTPPVTRPVKKAEAPSIEEFQTYMDRPPDPSLGPAPLILRNAIADWPATSTRPWSRPSYLLSQTFDGRRLVPVEIGRSYVDEGWGQRLITFGEFLREHIDPSSARDARSGTHRPPTDHHNSETEAGNTQNKPHATPETNPARRKPTAYLAQHQLFTQLPALRNDILIPDYCYTAPPPHPTDPSLDQPELEAPLLNAWFGPAGTISPLHHDPYHNILAQVVGRKYVRLYAPRETARLAARGTEGGVDMGNTSRLDVGVLEAWDCPPVVPVPVPEIGTDTDTAGDETEEEEEEEKESDAVVGDDVEAFRAIPFVDCILEPGDALYIPIGWWHYVRGLSVSFSVSFWWN